MSNKQFRETDSGGGVVFLQFSAAAPAWCVLQLAARRRRPPLGLGLWCFDVVFIKIFAIFPPNPHPQQPTKKTKTKTKT
jgi:hypothetical protein